MKLNQPFFRTAIRDELARRCERNPRYSIRAFSKAIGINDGAASQILSGKRIPSDRTALKIVQQLELAPDSAERFWSSLRDTQSQKTHSRKKMQSNPTSSEGMTLLSSDEFKIIADWYHVAILELTRNPNFSCDSKTISKALNISETEAAMAIQRLKEQKLIVRNRGRFEKREMNATTSDKTLTTSAHRRHQRQMLKKAIEALDEVPIESRVQVGMTMNIDPMLIPKARQMIQKFSEDLCKFLESGGCKRVCQLSIGLFPLEVMNWTNLETKKMKTDQEKEKS